MSPALQRKRAAKAARRKAILTDRRKLEAGPAANSVAARARRASRAPIRCCLIHDGIFERGNGLVILARGARGEAITLATFLVDVFCLGVKDVEFQSIEPSRLEDFLDAMDEAAPLREVEPSYARKLLLDAAQFASTIGFAPHRDFAAAELLFGDASAGSCATTFPFGRAGKPFYMPGPSETAAQMRQRLLHLAKRLGFDGFDFMFDIAALDDDAIGADEEAAPPIIDATPLHALPSEAAPPPPRD